MKARSEFLIPFLGLSNGIHHFDFLLGNDFFDTFEKSRIKEGSFELQVTFEKRDRMVILQMKGKGTYRASCDRCLAQIDVPVDFVDRIILKLDEVSELSDTDEIYFLDPKTSHIDIAPYIYEAIHLNMPIKNVRDCQSESEVFCDKEVLRNLLNERHEELPDQTDNPWSELKKLNLD